ncbi:MAG: hypothetical protein PHE68_00285 [Candidatus Peribacteraceae bacterium]|nr:hypothetical protein [Candidatus Peribacteraceae bacterium]MDD5074434.1 hypothetical protein [Candidatus Peribacteraceae bacterium]
MESTLAPWTPDRAVQITLQARQSDDPNAEKNELTDALDDIERRIFILWRRLDHYVEQRTEESIRQLIDQIRADEKEIISLCISRVDHEDPESDILHDLTNNDFTLNLREELAIAAQFGCVKRVIFLHRLQKAVCRRLKELGINVSRN